MIKKRLLFGGFVAYSLLYLFFRFWPIYLDRPFDKALHIYWNVKILNEPMKISSIFPDSDTVCIQGAYENLHDAKYNQFFSSDVLLDNQRYLNQVPSYPNDSLYLIGFRENKIHQVFRSNFFVAQSKISCVANTGNISLSKTDERTNTKIRLALSN